MKRKRVMLGGIGLATIAALAWAWTPRSLEWHANHVLDCIEQRNSVCIAGYARQHELAGLGIDAETLVRILDKEVFPAFVRHDPSTRARLSPENLGQLTVTQSVEMSDGSIRNFGITVAKTDQGVKCPFVLIGVFSPVVQAKYFTKTGKFDQYGKILAFVDWADTDGPRLLTEYGLKGVYRSDQEGLLEWGRYRAKRASILPPEIIEAMRKADQLAR